ncbi:MAG: hypothetical protein QOK24_984, partial [Verrucomicrobiota bacterium]
MRPQTGQARRAFARIIPCRGRIFARCSIIACWLAYALLLTTPKNIFAFSLNGYRWPSGSQVGMNLGLNRPPVAFQDGSASWNASAADALAIWNQYIDTVKFVEAPAVAPSGGDGANSVFFSSTIYGDAWGSNTLAVTINYSNSGSGVFTETDVIFHSGRNWNSHRGPVQGSGPTATFDLHRVALHEFGHVLGLTHPDEHGQNVTALMNSIIGDLDHLADDDIAGARSLYAVRITSNLFPFSVQAGDSFVYQITANNNPSSFDASPLPPGLQIDSSGRISGIPTAGGTYDVTVIAHGVPRDVLAIVRIVVIGPTITSNSNPSGVAVGNNFNYQITSSKTSTSYEATGLPPGLELDANTGLISGVATISGTYYVTVFARGPFGEATARLSFIVLPNPIPPKYDDPSLTLPVGNGPMATDSMRDRLYVASGSSIAVVDTASPRVVTTIPISDHYVATTLSISPDGKILWFVRTNNTIGKIDLESLTALPDLLTTERVGGIREGLDHRLYCPSWNAGMLQLDATSGALQARFDTEPPSPGIPNYCSVEISPDRKTLYVGQSPAFPGIHKYDVSTSTPMLLQAYKQSGNLGSLSVSHDGSRLCFWTSLLGTNQYETRNITQPLGLLQSPRDPYNYAIFAQDDSLIFQLVNVRNAGQQIAVYNAATRQLVRTIALPPKTYGYEYLGVDAGNSYVIACGAGWNGDPPRLLFYPINVQAVPVPPYSLLNVSTRAFVQAADDVEIGGFIIQGSQPKKVVVRAIGPSLVASNVTGAMADPVLELHDSGGLIASNDNWNSHRTDVIETALAPSDEHEAVIVRTLAPGSYTVVLRGVNDTTGVGLFELYDIDPTNSRIA